MADRHAEEDRSDLEEGDVRGRRGVGRRRAVSRLDCRPRTRCCGMKAAAALLVTFLWLAASIAPVQAQETQAEPTPVSPATKTRKEPPAEPQKKAAPIERRASRPSTGSTEPEAGPLTKTGSGQTTTEQPVNRGGDVATIRVKTRLVNVALNVVDAKGSPVGGFEKKDFQLFEDGKPQTIAVFEREATSDRLERAAAKHFVHAILREQDELDLMDFSDTVREIVPFTNQAKRIEQGLGQLQQGDETALYNAIYLASERLAATSQAANRRRVLVIISDGGDSIHGGERYEDAIEQAQRAGAIIYSIIIVPVAADAGRNTGGEHALIQMAEDP